LVGGPVALTESVLVKARAFDGSEWSALSEAVFVPEEPCPLRVTEIMYHPPDPEGAERSISTDAADYEFIELQNTGDKSMDLVGVRLTAGVPFDFTKGSVPSLAPCERAIVVRDLDAFKARYGEWQSMNIAGEYSRHYPPAPRLANEGEAIELADGAGRVIQSFVYDDGWHPCTDGEGFSLTVRDAHADTAVWNTEAGWRASTYYGGSPGREDP
jgi:hypothetical protein